MEGWCWRARICSAYFVDAAGGRASLIGRTVRCLCRARRTRSQLMGLADVNSAGGVGGITAPPAYDGPVTFESIAKRQKQEMEAKANANADKP